MRIYKILFVLLLALFFAACNPVKEIDTPTETLKKIRRSVAEERCGNDEADAFERNFENASGICRQTKYDG